MTNIEQICNICGDNLNNKFIYSTKCNHIMPCQYAVTIRCEIIIQFVFCLISVCAEEADSIL